MTTRLNSDGQPINWRLNASRKTERALDELIGLCKGVLADGRINHDEAQLLLSWLRLNEVVQTVWPANILAARFEVILADGVIDDDELADLEATIQQMIGGTPVYGYRGMMATRLPLDDPPPVVEFPGRSFCITGKCVYGMRRKCQEAVTTRGGACTTNPTLSTDYLVVGAIGSADWIHSTHGRKIEKAVGYQQRGVGLSIVAEEHWTQYL